MKRLQNTKWIIPALLIIVWTFDPIHAIEQTPEVKQPEVKQPKVKQPEETADDKEETVDETEEADDLDFEEDKKIFSLNGHFKYLMIGYRTDQYSEYQYIPGSEDEKKRLVADLKRVRLTPEINVSDWLHIHLDFDNEVITGSYLGSREFDEHWRYSEANDYIDMAREPSYDEDLYYRRKIHRAFVKLVMSRITITMGRQQVRFGSGKLWNPLDILNPISPTAIEGAEEQKGIDAIRMEFYPTDKTEFALVYDQKKIKDDEDESRINNINSNMLGRFKTTIGKSDIAILGGRVSRRNVGGADMSFILLGGMLRGSVIYSDPETGKSFLQGGSGYEYVLPFGLSILVEYFYNQGGLNFDRELRNEYQKYLMRPVTAETSYMLTNRFLTYNKHYSGLALGYDITPILRADIMGIYDFQGKGIFYNPVVTYRALDDLEIRAGMMKAYIDEDAGYESDFVYLEKEAFYFGSLSWFF